MEQKDENVIVNATLRKAWKAIAIGVVGGLLMSGCGSSDAELQTCASAVASTPPIEGLDGFYFLVSSDLASTIDFCSSVDEWTAALQARPEVVDVQEISDEDALAYLAAVCQLRESEGVDEGEVCAEALAAGLLGY